MNKSPNFFDTTVRRRDICFFNFQAFPEYLKFKEVPQHMLTKGRQVVKNGQNVVNIVCERPLSVCENHFAALGKFSVNTRGAS